LNNEVLNAIEIENRGLGPDAAVGTRESGWRATIETNEESPLLNSNVAVKI
jgi:hypothetical protein